jgi:hypothetical protein
VGTVAVGLESRSRYAQCDSCAAYDGSRTGEKDRVGAGSRAIRRVIIIERDAHPVDVWPAAGPRLRKLSEIMATLPGNGKAKR